jgi:hypothetical protein
LPFTKLLRWLRVENLTKQQNCNFNCFSEIESPRLDLSNFFSREKCPKVQPVLTEVECKEHQKCIRDLDFKCQKTMLGNSTTTEPPKDSSSKEPPKDSSTKEPPKDSSTKEPPKENDKKSNTPKN